MAGKPKRLPDGRYRIRWTNPDGTEGSKTVPDHATALTVKRAAEQAIALGQAYPPPAPQREPTAHELAVEWLTQLTGTLARKTLYTRACQLDVWATFRADYRSPLWTRQMLMDYLAWLRAHHGRHGHPRARSTALRYVEVIEALWAWAVDWQVERPDWAPLPPARRITTTIPRPATPWRALPTWGQMAACVAAASPPLQLLLATLYYVPIRVNQALALWRGDLDFDSANLWIRPELGKSLQEQTGRLIPVSRHFVELVRDVPPVEGGWLLPWARKQRVARDRDAAAAWRRAQIPESLWKGRPHHVFRGGHMSNLRGAGAPWDAVEWLAGHAATPTAPNYLDPHLALRLREVVDLVPKLVLEGEESQ